MRVVGVSGRQPADNRDTARRTNDLTPGHRTGAVRAHDEPPPTPTLSCGLMDRRKHRAVVSGWSGDCTNHLNQDTRKY